MVHLGNISNIYPKYEQRPSIGIYLDGETASTNLGRTSLKFIYLLCKMIWLNNFFVSFYAGIPALFFNFNPDKVKYKGN